MDQTGTSKHDIEHSGTAEGGQLLGYVTLKFLKRFLLHCLFVVHAMVLHKMQNWKRKK
jgi:hypothetical protein